MYRTVWGVVVGLLVGVSVAQAQTLAFPTAEGAGRFAVGGRGGKAYNINSLSAELGTGGSCNAGGCGGDGPFAPGTITLRDCLHDRFGVGARTCIFRVGGRIDFPCSHEFGPGGVYLGTQSCKVYQPYITIAGQTAPGDGVMLSSMNLAFEGNTVHDIIVRHLRIRTGANVPQACCCPTACPDGNNLSVYGYAPNTAHDIIFDHVSLGWGRDDTMIIFGYVRNMTMQHMLWSEGLGNGGSDPSKMGGCGYNEVGPIPQVSLLHSLIATYTYRTPNIGGCNMEVVNNVIYGVYNGPQVFPFYEPIKASFVNNYFKPNANAQDPQWDPYIVLIGCGYPGVNCTAAAGTAVEVHGNLHSIQRPTLETLPEPALVYQFGGNTVPVPTQTTSLGIFAPIPSQTTADHAYLRVLGYDPARLGAGARVPLIDRIDQRAISDVVNGTGSPLTNAGDEAFYGGFPPYASGTPYPDADGDGISDTWEIAHGLNPHDAGDGPVITATGYSNLERFVNELAGDGGVPPQEPIDPVAPVQDAFDRPDEGPPPSAQWQAGVVATHAGLAVRGQSLVTLQPGQASAWWQARPLPADVAVQVTWKAATAPSAHVRLYLRLAAPGIVDDTDGYVCQAETFSDPATGTLVLRRLDQSGLTGGLAQASAVPWAAGDTLRCGMQGAELCGERQAAGTAGWTKLVCLTDATYAAGGFVGVGLNHPDIAVDAFSAAGAAR